MNRKPIVVGVDDSPESRRAVVLAWKIAKAAGAPLIPVHAVPDLWLAGGLDEMPVMLPEIREALVRDSRKQIERFLAEALPREARPRLEIRSGAAAFAIADVARARGAQLVVLGGREHGLLARGLGRSTAHYLVRTLDVPLLVVAQPREPFTRILTALDLSDTSVPTLKTAERFAHLLHGELRIAHIVEPLRLMYLPIAPFDQEGFAERSREGLDRLLAPLAPVVRENAVVRTGPAAATIIEEATAWRADLVVVGSHGKGLVDRLLLGSTTERLLNALPTSLLVVPAAVPARHAAKRRVARKAKKTAKKTVRR